MAACQEAAQKGEQSVKGLARAGRLGWSRFRPYPSPYRRIRLLILFIPDDAKPRSPFRHLRATKGSEVHLVAQVVQRLDRPALSLFPVPDGEEVAFKSTECRGLPAGSAAVGLLAAGRRAILRPSTAPGRLEPLLAGAALSLSRSGHFVTNFVTVMKFVTKLADDGGTEKSRRDRLLPSIEATTYVPSFAKQPPSHPSPDGQLRAKLEKSDLRQ